MESIQKDKNYAIFSKKQFENKVDRNVLVAGVVNMPYIYYKKLDGSIVMVTEIYHDPNKKSCFDDAVYLGEVGKFYKASTTPLT